MAKAVQAKWIGREKLMRDFERLVPELQTRLATAQLREGDSMVEKIRVRAPVNTGKYRRSLRAARLDAVPGARNDKLVFGRTKDPNAVGIFGLFIWHWLEFGTVRQPAQPHILPTWRAERKGMKRRMSAVLRRAVNKVFRGQAAPEKA